MAKVRARKVPNQDTPELLRWCIENAIRWPTDGGYGTGGAGFPHGYVPKADSDVIGRAKKLLDWVLSSQRA